MDSASARPVIAETLRQAGGWGGAAAGAKIGGWAGAALGIRTGPGVVAFALGGSVILGTLGYYGFGVPANAIEHE